MQFLSDFADQAVILPLVLATALALWLGGWARGAIAWLLVCGVTLATVGVAKLAVFTLGPFPAIPLLLSPSGHTASAALVYGGLIGLLFTGTRPRHLVVIAAALASAIGLTRMALGLHTLPDTLVGAAIGLAGAAILELTAGHRPDRFHRLLPIGFAAAVLLGFHGLRMPAEPWLRVFAATLAPSR